MRTGLGGAHYIEIFSRFYKRLFKFHSAILPIDIVLITVILDPVRHFIVIIQFNRYIPGQVGQVRAPGVNQNLAGVIFQIKQHTFFPGPVLHQVGPFPPAAPFGD